MLYLISFVNRFEMYLGKQPDIPTLDKKTGPVAVVRNCSTSVWRIGHPTDSGSQVSIVFIRAFHSQCSSIKWLSTALILLSHHVWDFANLLLRRERQDLAQSPEVATKYPTQLIFPACDQSRGGKIRLCIFLQWVEVLILTKLSDERKMDPDKPFSVLA